MNKVNYKKAYENAKEKMKYFFKDFDEIVLNKDEVKEIFPDFEK